MRFTVLAAIAALIFVSCDKKDENPAKACFDFSPQTELYSGDDITFTNCSKDADSYLWDFGDGNTSVEESPVHSYEKGGEYSVSLLAYGHTNDTIVKTVSINALIASACFEFSPNSDIDPDTEITFTNCSQTATEYLWDFGDGTTSTEENPKHSYTIGGDYNVILIAKNEVNDTISKTISINITNSFAVNGNSYTLSQGLIQYFGETGNDSYNHDIVLLSEGIQIQTQDGQIIGATGKGEVVYFELFSALSDKIADGEYIFADGYAAGTFDMADIQIGYDVIADEDDIYYEIIGGSINITTNQSFTQIIMNLTTSEGYLVTGSFEGEMPTYIVEDFKKTSSKKSIFKK